ncbi:MAG: U32 family peptidase [Eubacteriales bacterium]
MPDIEFSAPYNNQLGTLEEIYKIKNLKGNKIREIYLSCPEEYSGTGRAGSVNTIKKLDLDEFIRLVDQIHALGFRVDIVMNSTCEGGDWYSKKELNKLIDFLSLMHKEYDTEAVTIANPIIIKEARKHFPELEISASVLGDIDSLQRAQMYADCGANVMTPDVNINRNLNLLREIKETTGMELKIMVNEGCLYKCAFRKFHFNYISHKSKELEVESKIFSEHCFPVTAKDLSQILKSCWIRPEDISKYKGITNYFKVVGRSMPTSKVIRSVKAYMQENWAGDIFDILCSNIGFFGWRTGASLNNKRLDKYNFFEKTNSCDRNCAHCKYCDELANKLISFGDYSPERLEDLGLKDLIGKSLEEAGLTDIEKLEDEERILINEAK